MLTLQQCFDKAYLGVVRQGRPSRSSVAENGCLYRGPENTKCAVGHLILDEHLGTLVEDNPACPMGPEHWPSIDLWLENLKGGSLVLVQALKNSDVPFEALTMLHDLQNAHDRSEYQTPAIFLREFKERAATVAKNHKLAVPEIE